MEKVKADLGKIASTVTGWFPQLNDDERTLSIQLYRLLANGKPVYPEEAAKAAGMPSEKVNEILNRWPGVFYDDDKNIIGYWGLAIRKMNHCFEVDGKTFYAWCAWDTLFIPAIIGKSAKVESRCPATKNTIRLTVTPDGVESADPDDIAVSFLLPETGNELESITTSFCCHVHFFSSLDAASKWVSQHPGTFVLSLKDAFKLGQLKNEIQYGDIINQ
ncbi:MAG: alkylmercury lyase [bacterium]|nr:MAG: alkylmercury lyase [bacterium]